MNKTLKPDDSMWGQVSDVLDFFQVIGTFAKSGYVDTKLLYKLFYYWLSHYWVACDYYIKYTQVLSPMIWTDAEWLYKKLFMYDKRHNKGALNNPNHQKLNDFFRWERDNL
jgi:hypothetical protein